ncbi:MAG: endonuclease [Proteobacteria bacterium]|nr:endonuclease [Pseudomonadota bacterium]
MRRLLLLGLALLGLGSARPALAWGEAGHHAVADIAMANIRPETAAAIATLLQADPGLGTPECRARTLREASVWPDCLRAEAWRWKHTFPWHYQDEPLGGPFDVKAHCPDDGCVTAQIERNRRILADRTLPAAQRLEALAFVVHFVGDIHQPLHAAELEHDAGGNAEVVVNQKPEPYILKTSSGERVVNANPKPPSFHWFWDKLMAERALAAEPGLVRAYSPAERAALATGTAGDWLKESWDAARTTAYPLAFGRDPLAGPVPKEITISDEAARAQTPLAAQRLRQAGLRLARLLDEALGS